ncbi:NADH-quinone oxidoreductase subunit NuoH [Mitsuokella jalaludinii]|uniref:NADH-quinone oxidoreductase subunit NuoH n=1 Tax=Mitsuokella jalaludinii TaxID=187979 RepID=UPI0029E28365|nr:NADH-quinone oxidoreductase subunit NuoH [Selenomonadaceae bacterium]
MEKSLLSGIARWIHGEISTLTGSPLLSDLVLIVIGIAALLGIISLAAIVFTYAERKVCAFMQMRLGPNRVGGRFGLLQPVADMLKLMSKEDIMPAGADKVLWALSPALLFVPAALVYAFFPFDAGAVLVDVNVGVFLLLAISSQAVLPFLMGGYASNNKYSMIGGFRIVSQMISYEAPLLFSLLGILMITGSMRLEDIVLAQQGGHWFLFLQPLAFIIFLISAIAETNRTPFDLVEGESEIIAGPFTEYSGMRWALFFLAEYANLLTAAILATTFFLGGYLGPSFLPGFVWFTLKSVAMVFLIMWFRWTFPRTRVDQMLSFSWKALLPLAILNVFLTGAIMYALDLV